MRVRPLTAAALAVAHLTLGCGGSGTDTGASPTPPATPPITQTPPAPPPTADPANVAGSWRGTLDANAMPSRPISMLAFQAGTCVDGAWQSESGEWTGAISGYADVGSFSGYVSIQRPADGPGRCGGLATFSGSVTGDTIRWTSSGFTGSCPGGLPQSVTMTLRRES